jgi:hypothetical protein
LPRQKAEALKPPPEKDRAILPSGLSGFGCSLVIIVCKVLC